CPGLIESGRWAWNFEAAARLRSLDPESRQRLARESGGSSGEAVAFVEWMKWLPAAQRLSWIERIRTATPGFEPTAEQRKLYDPMSWSELQSIDPGLVTIGSHTV